MDTEKKITVTKKGLEMLQQELEYLKTVKREEVKEAIKVARSFGDLSENSEYDEAKTEEAKTETRIVELEEMLKNAVLIEEDSTTDKVSVGMKVKVFHKGKKEEIEYTIVGSTEANPVLRRISDQSPIGKALIGEKVGSTVKVEAPAGVTELEILEISRPEE